MDYFVNEIAEKVILDGNPNKDQINERLDSYNENFLRSLAG